MANTRIPTFSRWGKKMYARKRGALLLVVASICFMAVRSSLRRYFDEPLLCDQPCPEAQGCEPLMLKFELSPIKIKLGQPQFLWYRAELKNQTCRRLTVVSTRGLVDSQDLQNFGENSGFWLTATGPDGKVLERRPPPGPDGGIAWNYGDSKGSHIAKTGTIHPYQLNYDLINRLRKSGKIQGSGYVDLDPGEAFSTISPVVRPYQIVATSVRTGDGGIADGFGRVLVADPPKFPEPPSGFNYLDRYSFDRPGRYTIRAGYSYVIDAYAIYPHWENRSFWTDLIGLGLNPRDVLKMSEIKVHLVSSPIVIEVAR